MIFPFLMSNVPEGTCVVRFYRLLPWTHFWVTPSVLADLVNQRQIECGVTVSWSLSSGLMQSGHDRSAGQEMLLSVSPDPFQ